MRVAYAQSILTLQYSNYSQCAPSPTSRSIAVVFTILACVSAEESILSLLFAGTQFVQQRVDQLQRMVSGNLCSTLRPHYLVELAALKFPTPIYRIHVPFLPHPLPKKVIKFLIKEIVVYTLKFTKVLWSQVRESFTGRVESSNISYIATDQVNLLPVPCGRHLQQLCLRAIVEIDIENIHMFIVFNRLFGLGGPKEYSWVSASFLSFLQANNLITYLMPLIQVE